MVLGVAELQRVPGEGLREDGEVAVVAVAVVCEPAAVPKSELRRQHQYNCSLRWQQAKMPRTRRFAEQFFPCHGMGAFSASGRRRGGWLLVAGEDEDEPPCSREDGGISRDVEGVFW